MCIEFWGVTNVSQGTRLAPALTSAIAGKLDGGPDIWKHSEPAWRALVLE